MKAIVQDVYGADHVIDYTRDDFTQAGRRYDVIFDTTGNRRLSDLRRALGVRGTLVIVGGVGGGRWLGGFDRQVQAPLLSLLVSQTLRPLTAKERSEDLQVLKELIEAGEVTPFIDRTYPLSDTAEAIRDVHEGHARGKVIVIIQGMVVPAARTQLRGVMKAIVCTAYGGPDVLKLEEVEKPRPKKGEVLVRIRATTASRADCEIRRFEFPAWIWLPLRLAFGVVRPRVRILGQEYAGDVESLGEGTTSFAPGDRVYGTTGIGLGAYAEYVRAGGRRAGSVVAPMPAAMSYAEAAAIPYGAAEALRFLRKGGIGAGQRILIIGAGGSFGTYAVQLAKHAGAEVVAVDSAGKLEMLREIGADQVIDYTERDFADDAGNFDIVFDVVGRAPFGRVVRLLRPGGRYVVANPHTSQFIRGLWASLTGDTKMIFSSGTATDEHLRAITKLTEAGRLRPVIDRQYPLDQMAEAHRYAETEQKKGNIVIIVGQEQSAD